MDLLAACSAFVHVSDAGSFTVGAARLRIPQSVASRRVAALEDDLGGRLLDRTGRRATLTPLGHSLLPRARRLVDLSDSLRREAVRARTLPFRLAVPADWSVPALAELAVSARRSGLVLDLRPGDPVERDEWARVHEVDASITCVPADRAGWRCSLGAGTAAPGPSRPLRIASLRPSRADRTTVRRIWLDPEDDVPGVRDELFRLRDLSGLAADQMIVATSIASALAEVISSDDVLLCTERQATDLRLSWRPLADVTVERGYALRGPLGSDVDRVADLMAGAVAAALERETDA